MKRLFSMFAVFALLLTIVFPASASASGGAQVVLDRTQTNIVICGRSAADASVPVTFMMTEKGKSFLESKVRYVYQCVTDEDGSYTFRFPNVGINFSDVDFKVTVGERDISRSVSLVGEMTSTYVINIGGTMDTKLSLDIEVENPLNSDKAFSLICAFYDKKGNMLSTETTRILPVGKTTAKSITATVPVGATNAKIFCWNNLDECVPIKRAVNVLKSDDYDGDIVQINLPEDKSAITRNPGKGWVRYGTSNTQKDPEASQKALDYCSVAYSRWDWCYIEPNEGEYNWAAIDNAIDYWDKHNMKFAFGIMNSDSATNKKFITPEWVFDAGAKYDDITTSPFSGEPFIQAVPKWDDPIFKAKLKNFVNALAERYDGDPRVAWVDIRSFGNYGEWHLYRLNDAEMPSVKCQTELAQIYVDAFKNTDLAICQNAVSQLGKQYLFDNDIHLRDDGAFTLDGSKIEAADGIVTITEMIQPYNTYKKNYGWSNGTYLKYFSKMKPSYMDLGEWGTDTEAFIADNEKLISYLTNKIGYNFFLSSVAAPAVIQPSESATLTFKWINNGITNPDGNASVTVALLDEGNNVLERFRTDCRLDNLQSGESVDDVVSINLSDEPTGYYKLAVGVFESEKSAVPEYKISNFGANGNGWYCFADVVKDDGGYRISSYLDEINVNGADVGARVLKYSDDSYILLDDLEGYLSENSASVLNDAAFELDGERYVSLSTLANDAAVSCEVKNNKVYISDVPLPSDKVQSDEHYWSLDSAFAVLADKSTQSSVSLVADNASEGCTAMQRVAVDYENIFTLTFNVSGAPVKAYVRNSVGETIGSADTSSADGKYSVRFNLYDAGDRYIGAHLLEPYADIVFETTGAGGIAYIDSISLEKNESIGTYKNEGILADYGAEVVFDSWISRNGSSPIERIADNPQKGRYCFKTVLGNKFSGAIIDITDALAQSGAGDYCFEGYFRTDSPDAIEDILIRPVRITGKDNSQTDFGGITVSDISGEWKYVKKEFTVTYSALNNMSDAAAIIGSGADKESGKALCFDGVRIRKIR